MASVIPEDDDAALPRSLPQDVARPAHELTLRDGRVVDEAQHGLRRQRPSQQLDIL